jgi:hypothetical protein
MRVVKLAFLVTVGASLAAGCWGQTSLSDTPPPVTTSAPDGGIVPPPFDGGTKTDAGDGGKKPVHPGQDSGTDAPDHTDGATGEDALPDYKDPGCPDAEPPTNDFECDPNSSSDQCGAGLGCYPFVSYPDTPCGQETYGAKCIFVGLNGQGESCDGGCQDHHLCVVSGQGTQCVKMCDLNQANPCSDGLVCVAVDIPGIGGCL